MVQNEDNPHFHQSAQRKSKEISLFCKLSEYFNALTNSDCKTTPIKEITRAICSQQKHLLHRYRVNQTFCY